MRPRKLIWWLLWPLLVAGACALCLLGGAYGAPQTIYRVFTKADVVDAVALHASRAPKSSVEYLRYFDFASVPPQERPKQLQNLGFLLNSLSQNDDFAPVLEVPGTEGVVAYVDLSKLRERDDHKGLKALVLAFDRLGELGSGPSPFREPYYHADVIASVDEVTETPQEETYYENVPRTDGRGGTYVRWDSRQNGYVPIVDRVKKTRQVKSKKTTKKSVKKVGVGAHFNKATLIGLVALTKTAFPIFTYKWFATNAIVEPRYHELLGVDDSEASYQKLAAVDEKTSDRRGSQVRGAVLFSEVAHHNRILERTPTTLCYGKGTYQSSYDFKTSIDLQDVLKDLLLDKADAKEVIFNLPNGLLGFAVFDANNKRLDKADGDVANDRRLKFRDTQVRTAYHCMGCHYPDRGWIDVDDEVRALAAKPIQLLSDSVSKEDSRRGDRIRQKYLKVDFNGLLLTDQAVVEAAMEAATRGANAKGLSCPEAAKLTVNVIHDYIETPVSLAELSAELGYPQAEVLAAVQTAGFDPVFVVLRAGRKARRDQVERAFAQVAVVLHLASTK